MHTDEIETALSSLYRKRAEMAEDKAANALHPGVRSFCHEVAEHWRDLADRMEHQSLDRRTWQVVKGLAQAAARATPVDHLDASW
jgi:hypothetical protein